MTEKAKAEELVAKYGKDTALACVEELIKEHTWDSTILYNLIQTKKMALS
jgi:hypothetical protein